MSKPRLVMILSETWTMTDPRDLRALVRYAQEAEDAGFDAVMFGEHLVMGPNSCYGGAPANPRDWLRAGNQVPDYPHPSGMHMLTAIASVTTRLRLLAAAVISPLRHPLLLAKDWATMDLLSEGRFIALPSVSWQEEEYAAFGVPFHERGAILDEQLAIWKQLWRDGSPVTHQGKYFQFRGAHQEPGPWRPEGVTLWTGGRSLIPAIRRRLLEHSQGLFLLIPPTQEELSTLDSDLHAIGRSLADIELAAIVSDSFTSTDDPLDIGRVADNAVPLRERGFGTFIVKPSQFIDSGDKLAQFAREAVKAFGA